MTNTLATHYRTEIRGFEFPACGANGRKIKITLNPVDVTCKNCLKRAEVADAVVGIAKAATAERKALADAQETIVIISRHNSEIAAKNVQLNDEVRELSAKFADILTKNRQLREDIENLTAKRDEYFSKYGEELQSRKAAEDELNNLRTAIAKLFGNIQLSLTSAE